MGHITSKNHLQLQKRLDMHAQGAPESEALFKILEILFTQEEAGLVSGLPIKFFTIEEAASLAPQDWTPVVSLTNQWLVPPTDNAGFRFYRLRWP